MADQHEAADRSSPDHSSGPSQEHRLEIAAINRRRNAKNSAPASKTQNDSRTARKRENVKWFLSAASNGDALGHNQPHGAIYDTVGLALSGGGVRSAAFCLGALQALNAEGRIEDIDYVSTVSGGGYMGASMVAGMSTANFFPFAYKQVEGGRATDKDLMDNPGVRHVRDHSNFLLPRGFMDLMASIAILLRGLVATLSPVMGVILICAWLTAFLRPDSDALGVSGIGFLDAWGPFTLSIAGLIALLVYLFFWAFPVWRRTGQQEVVNAWPTTIAWRSIIAIALVAFVELQPQILLLYFWVHEHVALVVTNSTDPKAEISALQGYGDAISAVIGTITKVLAPLGALAALFTKQLQGTVKSNPSGSGWTSMLARVASKALLWWAAAALPLILWMVYLTLSYWAIAEILPTVQMHSGVYTIVNVSDWTHTPDWLRGIPGLIGLHEPAIKCFLGIAGLILVVWTFCRDANFNTLHAIYRERLAAAFLFDIRKALVENSKGHRQATTTWAPEVDPRNSDDDHLPPLGPAPHKIRDADDNSAAYIKLSELADDRAPYLLINTALNIQGSRLVNKRGRNADFFLLSKFWIGSPSTGYAHTLDFEKKSPGFDLATAIAISGAAASSNMGSASIRPLTPTLALLNIRLGYWAENPFYFDAANNSRRHGWPRSWVDKLYLLCEMFSIIDERSERVYLTDGGHVENLGVYELLRRRCRFIICIDGECDPGMTFGSFATLQRYARIDLGVRIDNIRWLELRKSALAAKTGLDDGVEQKGPHAILGDIDYPGGPIGKILYVKSSLSGDESDIILDYKRAYDAFPQETTGDQFFTEEQFEAYRALGFHAMFGALSGRDRVPGLVQDWPADGSPPSWSVKPDDDREAAVKALFDGPAWV